MWILFRSPLLGQILVPKNADHFQIIKKLYLMTSELLRRRFFGHHSWVRFWFSKRGPLSNPKKKVIFSDFATVVWILFRSPLLGQILVPKNADHFQIIKKLYLMTSELLRRRFFGHHSWVRFWFSKRGPLSNPKKKVIFSDFATVGGQVLWPIFGPESVPHIGAT